MFSTPIHVIDFEGSRQSGILEYGVVTLRAGRIDATHTRLCRAHGTISDRDRRQHGISEEAVAEAAPFDEAWDLFARLRESGPLCAHHAAVEDGLIRSVWPYPRNSPDFSEEGARLTSWGPWLDTLQLYRRIYPQLGKFTLGYLVECFNLGAALEELAEATCPAKRGRYHCALYDALASALLLRNLMQEPSMAECSLRWFLLQSASTDAGREAMGQQEFF